MFAPRVRTGAERLRACGPDNATLAAITPRPVLLIAAGAGPPAEILANRA